MASLNLSKLKVYIYSTLRTGAHLFPWLILQCVCEAQRHDLCLFILSVPFRSRTEFPNITFHLSTKFTIQVNSLLFPVWIRLSPSTPILHPSSVLSGSKRRNFFPFLTKSCEYQQHQISTLQISSLKFCSIFLFFPICVKGWYKKRLFIDQQNNSFLFRNFFLLSKFWTPKFLKTNFHLKLGSKSKSKVSNSSGNTIQTCVRTIPSTALTKRKNRNHFFGAEYLSSRSEFQTFLPPFPSFELQLPFLILLVHGNERFSYFLIKEKVERIPCYLWYFLSRHPFILEVVVRRLLVTVGCSSLCQQFQ